MGSRVNAAGTEEDKKRETKEETVLEPGISIYFTVRFNTVERNKLVMDMSLYDKTKQTVDCVITDLGQTEKQGLQCHSQRLILLYHCRCCMNTFMLRQ